jgi:hypothetical protein
VRCGQRLLLLLLMMMMLASISWLPATALLYMHCPAAVVQLLAHLPMTAKLNVVNAE